MFTESDICRFDIRNKDCRDINVFIPIQSRAFFLEPCVRYLQKSAELSGQKVNITIIENDLYPAHRKFCAEKGLDYIFISCLVMKAIDGIAKSLCYNIGYLLTVPAKWSLFHDLDILVPIEFFSVLNKHYMYSDFSWVQPYQKRRVILLSALSVMDIIESDDVFDISNMGSTRPARPGSTGGSLLVNSKLFEWVGGYDPEFFWGYAPEDNFFWLKLEISQDKIGNVFDCHAGGAIYADNPALDVFHMDHPLKEKENPDLELMKDIYTWLKDSKQEERIKFLSCKRDILSRAKVKIKESEISRA